MCRYEIEKRKKCQNTLQEYKQLYYNVKTLKKTITSLTKH